MENYNTLCFKSKKTATKNESEIKSHFGNRFLSSSINKGIDERGNSGFYVKYSINK